MALLSLSLSTPSSCHLDLCGHTNTLSCAPNPAAVCRIQPARHTLGWLPEAAGLSALPRPSAESARSRGAVPSALPPVI